MKKSFKIEIKSPCDANLNQMPKTAIGFYCSMCTKDVIDFTSKSNFEISKYISENKNICAKLKTTQLEQEFNLIENSKSNNLKYAVAVAASVLLTTNIVAQEKTPVKSEISCPKPNPHIVGKMIAQQNVSKIISITIKGKLLDSITQKPFSEKQFQNIYIYTNGSKNNISINKKTGEFEMPLMIEEDAKELNFMVYSNDNQMNKTIKINLKNIKNNILNLKIVALPKEFHQMNIAGGLGINYSNNKQTKS